MHSNAHIPDKKKEEEKCMLERKFEEALWLH